MRAAKFAVGDLVRIADAMSDSAVAYSSYRRSDRLSVLSVSSHVLDDGAVSFQYLVSGERWMYEHALEKAEVHTEVRLVVDASAVEKALAEMRAALHALKADMPKAFTVRPGRYRTRSNETVTIASVSATGDITFPAEGQTPPGAWASWTVDGRFYVDQPHSYDLVARIGDLP